MGGEGGEELGLLGRDLDGAEGVHDVELPSPSALGEAEHPVGEAIVDGVDGRALRESPLLLARRTNHTLLVLGQVALLVLLAAPARARRVPGRAQPCANGVGRTRRRLRLRRTGRGHGDGYLAAIGAGAGDTPPLAPVRHHRHEGVEGGGEQTDVGRGGQLHPAAADGEGGREARDPVGVLHGPDDVRGFVLEGDRD